MNQAKLDRLDIHHISFKTFAIPDYIDTAMRVVTLGLPLNNEEFVYVTDFLRTRRQRAQEVNK